jgi:glycerophosphoryl diester phosphodiesterase
VIDAVGKRLLLNIELKVHGQRDDGLAAAVVSLVAQNRLRDRVVVSSFSRLAVRRVKRLDPQMQAGWLYGPTDDRFLQRSGQHTLRGLDALHPYFSMVDDDYVHWAKSHGYRVHVWTVDDPVDMQRLARQGVDMIITNRPDLLRGIIGGPSSSSEEPGSSSQAGPKS